MIKCSACILTYNSEKTLEQCLESIKDFSDIVIMDGGSTDNTLEIARKYNARIFFQKESGASGKIENFTDVRRKLYSKASEDWILCIDSDEYIDEKARQAISKITSQGEKYKNILFRIKRKAIIGGRIIHYAYCYPEYGKRLWHAKSSADLKGSKQVHEDMVVGSEMQIKDLDIYLYHFWHEGYKDLIAKDDYYLELALKKNNKASFYKRVRKAFLNILKAGNVLFKSLKIYLGYGFKESLPPIYVWRFARYHLIIAIKSL